MTEDKADAIALLPYSGSPQAVENGAFTAPSFFPQTEDLQHIYACGGIGRLELA
jgi:hypothetical protein